LFMGGRLNVTPSVTHKGWTAENLITMRLFDLNGVTSNQVRLRGAFFGVSALVLAIMWIIYIVEMLTSPWV